MNCRLVVHSVGIRISESHSFFLLKGVKYFVPGELME